MALQLPRGKKSQLWLQLEEADLGGEEASGAGECAGAQGRGFQQPRELCIGIKIMETSCLVMALVAGRHSQLLLRDRARLGLAAAVAAAKGLVK